MQANQTTGNYIYRLQATVRHQHELLAQIRQNYNELLVYFLSDKFYQDPTVQVADVMRRLDPLHCALIQAESDPTILHLTKPVIATGEITSL